MKNKGSSVSEKLVLKNKDNQLLVSDIVQYVVNLAKLNKDKRIGNPHLAEALRCVANVLRPFRDHPPGTRQRHEGGPTVIARHEEKALRKTQINTTR